MLRGTIQDAGLGASAAVKAAFREVEFCQYFAMDGRGRALDNIFIERLMSYAAGCYPAHRVCHAAQDARSLKYEDIYIKDYSSVPELEAGLYAYFVFYNTERPYQGLGYLTPAEVHCA